MTWFSIIFTKGNNFHDFLFALLDNEALLKWVNSERKKMLLWSIFFLFKTDPHSEGGKNENNRFTSPENVSIHFNPIALRMVKTLPVLSAIGLKVCH